MSDSDEYPNDLKKFKITCKKCGGCNVQVSFDYQMGSEETGIYGEQLTVRCRECGEKCNMSDRKIVWADDRSAWPQWVKDYEKLSGDELEVFRFKYPGLAKIADSILCRGECVDR
jgi:RNase P subunit RPR2